MVDYERDFCAHLSDRPNRVARAVWTDVVPGAARIRDPAANAARGSSHTVLGILHIHALAVFFDRHPVVWNVRHSHSGVRILVCADSAGDRGRYRSLPGARLDDPMGIDDLCVLPELHAGPLDAADPGLWASRKTDA